MVINDRIAKLIVALNINQTTFSDKIGVKSAVISNIIKGRRNKPSYDVILKILKVYNSISTDWLLKGQGEMMVNKQREISDQNEILDLETRITSLLDRLTDQLADDPIAEELSELIILLMEENNYHKNKIVRLYDKNEKLMDALREQLSLDS